MGKSDEKDDAHTIEPFACVEAGERYKLWRRDILALSAKYTDDSGSSCADYLIDQDQGGNGVGAPPIPSVKQKGVRDGVSYQQRQKLVSLRQQRAKKAWATIYNNISCATY